MKKLKRIAAYIMVLVLCLSIVAYAEENVTEEETDTVRIEFGKTDINEGITLVDGLSYLEERGGRFGRRTGKLNGSYYGCLAVDDNFIYNCPNYTPLEVTIEYFDEGNGIFSLQYDSYNESPRLYAPGWKTAGLVYLGNTKEWKTYTYYIEDAKMRNASGKGGSDLRIGIWDGYIQHTQCSPSDVIFGSVTVKKVEYKTPVLFDGISCSERENFACNFTPDEPVEIDASFTNKTFKDVALDVKATIYDGNGNISSETKTQFDLSSRESGKVKIKGENPKKYGIYDIDIEITASYKDGSKTYAPMVFERTFAITKKIAKEDVNPASGVCTHIIYNQKGDADKWGLLSRQAGISIVREEIRWDAVEKEKGQFQMPKEFMEDLKQYKENGVDVLLICGFGPKWMNYASPSTDDEIQQYANYCEFLAKETKGYTVKFKYKNDVLGTEKYKKFNAYIVSSPKDKTEFIIDLVSCEKLNEMYESVNKAVENNDFAEFEKLITENGVILNMTSEFSGNDLTGFFEYVKENALLSENEADNTRLYRTFMILEEFNKGTITNVHSYIDDLYFKAGELREKYNTIVSAAVIEKYFSDELLEIKFTGLDDFEEKFKEAYILTVARYGSSYGELKEVMQEYKNEIGIMKSTSDKVYQKLIGKEYESLSELKAAYDKLNATEKSSSSGGGGGGGGGGSRSGKGGDITAAFDREIVSENNATPTKNRILYDDLDGALWASEAVYALTDKGIINGKAEGVFAPNDNITREEFVKILICAMGMENNEANYNAFSDIRNDDWFSKYVNIAYRSGIVKGVGDGKFGVGMNITREDMVTMIYNAMKFKGVEIKYGNLLFNDSESIAEYAKEAVNALYTLGAVNGVSETEFAPKNIATRAQAVKIIYGVLDKLQ